jgi:DNA (cytosine-5)-methyltransferase 1
VNALTRYHLPTVSAIRQIPPNGLKVVSTFSGGGGTCLGMTLAGYDVVWANDCDPHARETYTANLGKPIDGRLLNNVTAADILSETGLKEGELDLFEGSPPCTKFSTAGRRQKGWNRKEIHAGKVQANTEDLFFEWIRLARGLRPKVFVAENVAGLVKGVAKGYFKDILKEMKSFGYRVEARLLDAKWLGVPQRRNRIIFIGVRDDLSRMPTFPRPLHRQWTVRQAIGDLLTSSSFMLKDDARSFKKSPDIPADAVVAHDARSTQHSDRGRNMIEVRGDRSGYRKFAIITDEPATTVVGNLYGINGGGSITAEMSGHIQMNGSASRKPHRHSLDRPSPTVQAHGLDNANMTTQHTLEIDFKDGYESAPSSMHNVADKSSPTIRSGRSFQIEQEVEAEQIVGNTDYRPTWGNLDQAHASLLSGGPNNGQGQLQYKTIRRHLTIQEVKRLCSFPDDYVLDGSFAKQWARLGNAVPPMMAYHIGRAIRDGIFQRGAKGRILS